MFFFSGIRWAGGWTFSFEGEYLHALIFRMNFALL